MLRFRVWPAAVLALVLVGAAGCTQVPAGVDKDLVDGWAMMAEAKVPEPHDGDCWTTQADKVYGLIDVPGAAVQTPCDFSHVLETVLVGHFTGPLADSDRAPSLGQMADTYKACDAELTKFLGSSWQNGRVRLVVSQPTNSQWHGGARFYRCDVAALRTEHGVLEPRKTTLKGTLAAGGEMLLGCSVMVGSGDSWTDLTPAACTAAHDVEFMGVVTAKTATYPGDDKALTAAFGTGCQSQIRTVTRIPDNNLGRAKASYGYAQIAGEDEWKVGNHNAWCYVMLPKKITRSLKGAGNITI